MTMTRNTLKTQLLISSAMLMMGAGGNLSAAYDYEVRENYDSHSGLLRLKYQF